MNRSKQLSRLLPRDDHLCGVHIGGCGQAIRNRADATVDHIFTQSFFREREDWIRPKDYNKDWNCQPMHHECNNKRGGQIYGFPMFTCICHWLQIERTAHGYRLVLHCNTGGDDLLMPVSTESHHFVFDGIAGTPDAQIGGVWSMGRLKPGKQGITGKGQMGHALPRIAPQEVPEFNRIETERLAGRTWETIEKYNRRMDEIRMQVHWRASE